MSTGRIVVSSRSCYFYIYFNKLDEVDENVFNFFHIPFARKFNEVICLGWKQVINFHLTVEIAVEDESCKNGQIKNFKRVLSSRNTCM